MKRHLRTSVLMGLLATGMFAGPVRAGDFLECIDGVMERCDDALAETSWWNIVGKVAVGNMCTLLLAGCGAQSIIK